MMIDNDRQEAMAALRQAVEARLGFAPGSPREFRRLSDDIVRRTGDVISSSTLMRIWGYVAGTALPHTSTLNVLARYADYNDAKLSRNSAAQGESSHDVLGRCLDVSRDLHERDRLLLRWEPGRRVTVRHLGHCKFVVERSECSKLAVGDTFTCHLIIEGEPLYIDNLVHHAQAPRSYVCGMHDGVQFEILTPETIISNAHD